MGTHLATHSVYHKTGQLLEHHNRKNKTLKKRTIQNNAIQYNMKHHNSIHLYINTIQCHFELIKGVQKWVSRMVCIIMFKVIRCLWLSNCAFFSVSAMKVLVV